MALIDDIISKINALPLSGGELTLPASDFSDLDLMPAFFDNVLKVSSLQLTAAARQNDAQSITVTGTAGLFGYTSLTLSINFAVQNNQVVATVTGTFDAGKTMNLPVLTWIKVGNITLTTTISQPFDVVDFAFGLNVITPDNTAIPVEIISMPNSEWRLKVAENTTAGVSASELISLLDGQSLDAFLPQALSSVLDNLVLHGLDTTFNTATKKITDFTVSVGYEKGWDIAPKVSLLPGIFLNLSIINADDPDSRLLLANVMGSFKIGSVVVPIIVGTSIGGTAVWSFGIQPGQKVTLPSFSDLLELGGGGDMLPTGLKDIPKIDIDDLMISFDSTNKVLTQLNFGISTDSSWVIIDRRPTTSITSKTAPTDSSWVIIDHYFAIEQLSINFEISNLTDQPNREVWGNLYGLFNVAGVDLFCQLAKTHDNPDWTITAGLPPGKKLNITALAKQLLEPQITLPQNLPTIDFTTLLVTVIPDKKYFKFEGGSTDKWEIITKKLSIDSFSLSFTNDPSNAPNNIQGAISTTLEVASVHLILSATMNANGSSGWLFTGQTQKGDIISIKSLICWFMDKYQLPEKSIPAWLLSITLKDLNLSFDTATKNFTFGITADATISDRPCDLQITFSLTKDATTGVYAIDLHGKLTIAAMLFDLDFKKKGTDSLLAAYWIELNGQTLGLADIAKLFGNNDLNSLMGDIPPSMDLGLASASFTYDFSGELVLTAVSKNKNYGDLVFVADKIAGSWVFVFLLALSKIDLTHLPLIGSDIGKLGTFEIDDLNLLLCSGVIGLPDIKKINVLINAAGAVEQATLPTLPEAANGLVKGVCLSMTFIAPGIKEPVQVNTATAPATGSNRNIRPEVRLVAAAASGGTNVATQNGYWINIQKAIGPVYADKIGINYSAGNLDFLFNFSLTLGPLSVTLNGLTIGTPLTKIDPFFALQGMSLTFKAGPVEISGGFVKTEINDITEYNGEALIKIAAFSLSALGSYARVKDHTSLFIFAMINEPPLGGPPALFITGVAAGFGYNRGLKIPDIDQVATFPLTIGFAGQTSPFSGPDPGKALEVLIANDIVPIQIGEDWLAAGISFTSFEMLQSFALVVVEFGTTLEIALLGMTTAAIPTGDPRPFVLAQLAIEVRILPDEGLFAVEAKLTSSSYLFDTSCHLTGGFAFYIWFGKNPNAGDFVVTIGGYHPSYVPPKYYPSVPRLGFNWVVTSEFYIKGGMYFALTSRCIMAGGRLEAVWQSGGLKAWFIVGADFIISWKPFYYEADIYLSFGVSFTFTFIVKITISLSLGVDLTIWGPSFAGKAHIHLWIISFTIDFGNQGTHQPPPISWSDFEASFLPKAPTGQSALFRASAAFADAAPPPPPDPLPICAIDIQSGLIKTLPPGTDNPDDINWIVRAFGTAIVTKTQIPAKSYTISIKGNNGVALGPSQIVVTNPGELQSCNVDFGVGPSRVAHDDFESAYAIEIVYESGVFSQEQIFYITAQIASVPTALWQNAAPGLDNLSSDSLIDNVLTGFVITTNEKKPDQTPWVDMSELETNNYTYSPVLTWTPPAPVSGPAQPADPIAVLEQTIGQSGNRTDIVAALVNGNFDLDTDLNLNNMAKLASDFLMAEPAFAYEYWEK